MNKIIFIVFLTLLFFSCTQESLLDTEANPWYGHFDKLFNNGKAKIYVDFFAKSRISLRFRFDYNDEKYYVLFNDGSYYIDGNHYLVAKITGEKKAKHIVNENSFFNDIITLWDNIADSLNLTDKERDHYETIKFKIKLTGYLYWYNDVNNGKYEMNIILKKTDGSIIEKTVKDDWELRKNK